jgi:hypothetical protein
MQLHERTSEARMELEWSKKNREDKIKSHVLICVVRVKLEAADIKTMRVRNCHQICKESHKVKEQGKALHRQALICFEL